MRMRSSREDDEVPMLPASGLIAVPKRYQCPCCESPQTYVVRYATEDEEIVNVCPECGEDLPYNFFHPKVPAN